MNKVNYFFVITLLMYTFFVACIYSTLRVTISRMPASYYTLATFPLPPFSNTCEASRLNDGREERCGIGPVGTSPVLDDSSSPEVNDKVLSGVLLRRSLLVPASAPAAVRSEGDADENCGIAGDEATDDMELEAEGDGDEAAPAPEPSFPPPPPPIFGLFLLIIFPCILRFTGAFCARASTAAS